MATFPSTHTATQPSSTSQQSHAPAAAPRVVAEPGTQGRLSLRFRSTGDGAATQTIVDILDQAPPLRMIRAFPLPAAATLVHLHNVSGGVLGGDRLIVTGQVGTDARAQITTTGATRIYRPRAERSDAEQTTHFSISAGGLLEYLPDPLIPYAAARFRQATTFDLAGDGGLFAWEVVTPGREARGECFAYTRLESTTRVTVDGRPLFHEHLALTSASQALTTPALFGGYRTWGTLLICRGEQSPERWRELEASLAELANRHSVPGTNLWGVSTLPADGIVVRALAVEGRNIVTRLPLFWQAAKAALYGLPAIMPRKIY